MQNRIEELRPHEKAGERNLCQFTELFQRHSADAMALAYSRLSNRADAEEVVQDAFLDAYRNLPRLRDPQKFGGWMRSIVINHCVDLIRRKSRKEKLHRESALTRDFVTPAEDLKEERTQAVTEAINSLPDLYREPLVLRHLRQLSYQQVAQALSVPLDTVRTRIARGDAMLREKLQRLIRRGGVE